MNGRQRTLCLSGSNDNKHRCLPGIFGFVYMNKSNNVEIEILNLNKSFRDNHILKNLNLKIPSGKTTVIMGGSGAGKTVLLKHIMGLLKPDSGKILIKGEDITAKTERELDKLRSSFAMVFQFAALLNSLTVGQNVGLGLKERGELTQKEINKIVDEKLRLVGLDGKQHVMPGELSGGMKKRVGVARALAMNPEVILYDEPTAGLDPFMAGNVDELILDLKNRLKMTSIVVTHDMNSAFYVGDRICMLHEGRVIEEGTPEEIQNSTNHITRQFITRHSVQNTARVSDSGSGGK